MQPYTLRRRECKGKIYVKNSRKIHVGSETGSGSGAGYGAVYGYGSQTNLKVGTGYGSEKNHSGSTTLITSNVHKAQNF
jgi:hypothetical protein